MVSMRGRRPWSFPGSKARQGNSADGDLARRRVVCARGLRDSDESPDLSGVAMTAIHRCGQARKGAWWMPRRPEAMKDVAACDMLRGAGKRALIRRSLN